MAYPISFPAMTDLRLSSLPGSISLSISADHSLHESYVMGNCASPHARRMEGQRITCTLPEIHFVRLWRAPPEQRAFHGAVMR